VLLRRQCRYSFSSYFDPENASAASTACFLSSEETFRFRKPLPACILGCVHFFNGGQKAVRSHVGRRALRSRVGFHPSRKMSRLEKLVPRKKFCAQAGSFALGFVVSDLGRKFHICVSHKSEQSSFIGTWRQNYETSYPGMKLLTHKKDWVNKKWDFLAFFSSQLM
jgi:hypothetical protein